MKHTTQKLDKDLSKREALKFAKELYKIELDMDKVKPNEKFYIYIDGETVSDLFIGFGEKVRARIDEEWRDFFNKVIKIK